MNFNFLFGLGQKASFESFQLRLVTFFNITFFLSNYIDIFRNLNHYQISIDDKKKFQIVAGHKTIKRQNFSIGSLHHKQSST